MASSRRTDDNVIFLDRRSAPRILMHGDHFSREHLPEGTRVIYPRPPMAALSNPQAAIRDALNHPEDMPPLHALLSPGMRVTIAVDDNTIPLPAVKPPDVRQLIVENVLHLLGEHGVDDIHIIMATALHRRMTEPELRELLGDRVVDAYWPDRLYNHDACDPNGMVTLGSTDHGETVELNRRAAESDLVIYVNVNYVPMNGGHKSVGVGLAGYQGLKAHHTPRTIVDSSSLMDPRHSALHRSVDRIGRVVEQHVKVFHIETALNNRLFTGPLSFLTRPEDGFSASEDLQFRALQWSVDRMPAATRQAFFSRLRSSLEMIAVHAGRCEAVHARILQRSYLQYCVPVKGQADILVLGIPPLSPYSVNSTAMNPLLVQVMALGYYFHMHRGKPLLRKDGVLVISHPCEDAFDLRHHPSYAEFFHRLLPITRDAYTLERTWQDEFASRATYVDQYRRGHAFHGAHPFYMWYWGQAGREHVGRIICAGGNPSVCNILGWERADNLSHAIAMARSHAGSSAQITMMHQPPFLVADVS